MDRTRLHPIDCPSELRHILLKFALSYMKDKPKDVIDYGLSYFKNLEDLRSTKGEESESSEEEISSKVALGQRRATIWDVPETWKLQSKIVIHPKSDTQRETLKRTIKKILFFQSLDDEQLLTIVDAMFERHISKGQYVIKKGEEGDYFYVIQSGIFNAYLSEFAEEIKLITVYENSGYFGELALLHNTPRAATIRAMTDGVLWAVGRATFKHILYKSANEKRATYEQFLANVPVLQNLTSYEILQVSDALVSKNYKKGQYIITQGDKGDGMYFIEKGTVGIFIQDDEDKYIEIKKIDSGNYFGELALLTRTPRAASAIALDDV